MTMTEREQDAAFASMRRVCVELGKLADTLGIPHRERITQCVVSGSAADLYGIESALRIIASEAEARSLR